jgi:hypothetical protein
MARYRATIKGNGGEASRLGSTASGITARVNGWDIGVAVESGSDPTRDVFEIYATAGSNDTRGRILLGEVSRDSTGLRFTPASKRTR